MIACSFAPFANVSTSESPTWSGTSGRSTSSSLTPRPISAWCSFHFTDRNEQFSNLVDQNRKQSEIIGFLLERNKQLQDRLLQLFYETDGTEATDEG